MTEIEVLDPEEAAELMGPGRWNTGPIHDSLVRALAVGTGIFVTGLTQNNIDTLRTRMERSKIKITVRKAMRGGNRGHVIMPAPLEGV